MALPPGRYQDEYGLYDPDGFVGSEGIPRIPGRIFSVRDYIAGEELKPGYGVVLNAAGRVVRPTSLNDAMSLIGVVIPRTQISTDLTIASGDPCGVVTRGNLKVEWAAAVTAGERAIFDSDVNMWRGIGAIYSGGPGLWALEDADVSSSDDANAGRLEIDLQGLAIGTRAKGQAVYASRPLLIVEAVAGEALVAADGGAAVGVNAAGRVITPNSADTGRDYIGVLAPGQGAIASAAPCQVIVEGEVYVETSAAVDFMDLLQASSNGRTFASWTGAQIPHATLFSLQDATGAGTIAAKLVARSNLG